MAFVRLVSGSLLSGVIAGVLLSPSVAAQAPAAAPAKAAPLVAQPYSVLPATSTVKVDGVLDDDAWAHAQVIPIAYEWTPGDNVPPPVRTDLLVTFDAKNLYLAFRAFDPRPSEIRAHLMDRDAIDTFVQDDHVTMMIDTFNDERRAYQFRVNALGVQADAVNSEMDGVEDWSWDAIWNSAGRVTAEGYIVEMVIPFRELRFPGGSEPVTFGITAERSYPRSVRHRISTNPRDRGRNCYMCQFNKVSGFQGMESGRNVEIDPTVTGSRTDERGELPAGQMENGPAKGEVGVTARWGISAGTTVTGTVNPDFSQVEADVAQLDVNTRFALFYPEKRPFFLEGLDYFSTPEQAVFTRTVADPSGGLKAVGKQGRNTFGVFVTRDRINNLLLPSNQSSDFASEDRDVTGTVMRYRRDVGQRSTLGGLYTGREGGPYFNRVIGPDVQFRLGQSEMFTFQYLRSETQYSPEIAEQYGQPSSQFGGNAVRATYDHFARFWFWGAGYTDRDEDFRADSGFIPRVDLRQATGYLQRRFWGTGAGWFTTFDLGLQGVRATDHDGQITDDGVTATARYQGPMQSVVLGAVSRESERYAGVMYEETVGRVNASIKPSGALALQLNTRFGDTVDYTNNQPATVVGLDPGIEWKVGAPLNLQLTHSYERLTVPAGWLYTANLLQFRAVWHFNRQTFVRAILQYTNVSRDPSLYLGPTSAKSSKLFSQYLFSYKLNPQTVLLAGYSDNYLGGANLSLTQTNRTLFIKVGYAWLL
jgi:hypothetical protein